MTNNTKIVLWIVVIVYGIMAVGAQYCLGKENTAYREKMDDLGTMVMRQHNQQERLQHRLEIMTIEAKRLEKTVDHLHSQFHQHRLADVAPSLDASPIERLDHLERRVNVLQMDHDIVLLRIIKTLRRHDLDVKWP
ncbi:MAG: hypothetical protein WC505_05970 [Patescibacteria group bacterium]